MKKVGKFAIYKTEEGFWTSLEGAFSENCGPIVTLEKVTDRSWGGNIMDGPWCENRAFYVVGSFNLCVKELRTFCESYQD